MLHSRTDGRTVAPLDPAGVVTLETAPAVIVVLRASTGPQSSQYVGHHPIAPIPIKIECVTERHVEVL